MIKMIKWIFKWALRLFLLAVVLIVVFFLSLNSILRVLIEHNIRAQTGMDAEIGRFELGLTEPTLTIQDLKIYNPPNFGGTPFLKIPEIHLEYDRSALAERNLHFTLVRFNLGELDIVKNAKGETNIFVLGLGLPKNTRETGGENELKRRGITFSGIDALNVSVGTLKYIDLKDQRNDRTQKVDIEDQIIPHVKSINDLNGLSIVIGLRSGDFLNIFVDHKEKKSGVWNLLSMLL
jgi:hypothetical protein